MSNSPSPLTIVLYVIVGLIIASVAIKVLWFLLGAVSMLIQFAVSLGVVLVVGYIIYALIKAAIDAVK